MNEKRSITKPKNERGFIGQRNTMMRIYDTVTNFKMRLLLINILLLFSTQIWSQTNIGIGVVSIHFDDKTVLKFYSDTLENKPEKVIEFFDDQAINSWNIKDLDLQRKWLNPEVIWLDYAAFSFRCLTQTGNWFNVIVNGETGKSYWLRKSDLTELNNWETYLKGMFGIERQPDYQQKIKTNPTENAADIEYQGEDCFVVKSMKGDWIEITTPDYCDENYTDSKTPIKSGWIKWRQGNKLIIKYFITS